MTRISQPHGPTVGVFVLSVVLLLSLPALIGTVFAAQEVPGGLDTPVTSGTAAPNQSVPDPQAVPGGLDTPDASGTAGPDQSVPDRPGITGLVQTPDGMPLPNVFVSPESLTNPPMRLPDIAILTDRQGVYRWNLPPGPYRLTFTAEGYQAASASVVVPVDRAARLDVRLGLD